MTGPLVQEHAHCDDDGAQGTERRNRVAKDED